MTTTLPAAPTDLKAIPTVAVILSEITDLEAFAKTYKVTTVEQFVGGAEYLKRVKSAQDNLEAERTKITGPLNAALKATNTLFRAPAEKIGTIEQTIKRALRAFDEEQERLRLQKQREADEAAQRERDRLAQEAREREAAAARKAQAERDAAEAMRQAGNQAEAEKLERKAQKIEERAAERIEVLQERAETIVAPRVEATRPTVAGLSRRQNWKYRIKDASKIPASFQCPDDAKIGPLVKAMKDEAVVLLGGPEAIEVYNDAGFGSAKA